ncbi:MAG: threonine-phosphate decarboxylase [Clostridia bacterium]|nr:threonine-phosphate decarboxylase [Clostridia bacterium]
MDYTHGGNVYKAARTRAIDVASIVDFSANINPLGLSDKGNQRLKDAWQGLLNYPDPEYVALREALSVFHKCRMSQIFLGNGAIDAIFFLMENLKPKRALVLAPTFVEYERALTIAGSALTFFYLKESEGFRLDLTRYLKEAETHDCLVICNPNNPTGQLVPKSDMMQIIEFAKRHGKDLVIDEAFMDFTDMDESQSCIDQIKAYDQLYILRSITKFFAVPGLRLGYVLSGNSTFAESYWRKKAPWCVNYFAQEYTIGALEDAAYIHDTKHYVMEAREHLYQALSTIDHIHPHPSMGNYIFLKYTGTPALKESLEERGILIRDCNNYHGLDEQYYRVAVKTQAQNERLVASIKEIIDETVD